MLLPMALVINSMMFHIQVGMFERQGLRVRRNVSGFLIYAFAYSVILQPACVWGYLAGVLGVRKTGGTQ
jgi:biofilm PGA synthesis N-glycosyltransferase PgaC